MSSTPFPTSVSASHEGCTRRLRKPTMERPVVGSASLVESPSAMGLGERERRAFLSNGEEESLALTGGIALHECPDSVRRHSR